MADSPYSVAIVHYHLHRGGVTRVIHTAARCLAEAGVPYVILSGEAEKNDPTLPVQVVEGLRYDVEPGRPSALQLVQAMRAAATAALGSGPVIWHFHNHSLGRNRVLADAVAILAEAGEPMILQFHDFAEDGRPQNYPVIADTETIYPYAPQIRYAFINSRDSRNLVTAGLPLENSLLLPNAITAPAQVEPLEQASPDALVLYPVRAIRRKNLGELFLLAALAPQGTRFAVSLGPDAARWMPYHEEWAAFAEDSGLPVLLDVVGRLEPAPGISNSFENWVRHSTHFITTSVAEGFGLGYLEAAAVSKPLLGRNLPEVTNDFAEEGIQPGRLYDRLLVPASWVGLETLRQRLIRSLRATLETYGQAMSNQQLDKSFAAMLHQGHVDFGNLPEDLQRQVLHRLLAGDGAEAVLVQRGEQLTPAKEWLQQTLDERNPTAAPEQLEPYSPDEYRAELLALYAEVIDSKPADPRYLPKHRVLAEFLKPGSFKFLCS